jgi:hypothetical protein
MARATKASSRAGKAKASAAPSPARSGSLQGRLVTCSLPRLHGRWTVATDDGGKLVRITRPPNLSTFVERATLTAA